MNLTISFQSELLKTKRTSVIWFTILAAFFSPLMIFIDFLDPESISTLKSAPWKVMFKLGFELTHLLVMPFYIILASTLLAQLEFRNNTWKQVFSSPQTKSSIFFTKFLTLHMFILVLLVSNSLLILATGLLVGTIRPESHVLEYNVDWLWLLKKNAIAYICFLGITINQFWLSLRFRNFISPVGIGILLWIAAGIMVFEMKFLFSEYYPHAYPLLTLFPKHQDKVELILWSSAGYTVIAGFLAWFDFRKRNFHN